MKKCYRCKVEKAESEFSSHKGKKDGLQSSCKACSTTYARQHYKKEEVKEKHLLSVNERRKIVVQANRELVLEYLQSHPCVDCGEADPIVLEFDHQRDKRMGVSRLIAGGYPAQTVLDEIAKCEVRCANCHRRKTARDQGWFKNRP